MDKPKSVIQEIVRELNIEKENSTNKNADLEIGILKNTIEAKENEKQSILDLFRKKLITPEDVEFQLKKINDEKQELLEKLHRWQAENKQNQDVKNRLSSAEKVLQELRKKINKDLSYREKREIIHSLVSD